MKAWLWRIGMVVLVALGSCLASAVTPVATDEVVFVGHRITPHRVQVFGYIAEPGWYLFSPFAEYATVKIGFHQPTTRDYLRAAEVADMNRDAWLEAEGPCNPRSRAEVEALVKVVIPYINAYEEAIARPVTLDAIEFFEPDKRSGRYEEEIAHYDYLARTMRFNMKWVRAMSRQEDESMLAIIVHELSHSALNIWTGEQLCQLLTLRVLHDMQADGVPGARFAYWDELRGWFLSAARFRVYFNSGYRALTLEQSREIEYLLSGEDPPKLWATHSDPETVRLPSLLEMVWNALRGHPYAVPLTESLPYVERLGVAAVEALYRLRVEGIVLRPGRWLCQHGVPVGLVRRLLGPLYWHKTIVLRYGERHHLEAVEEAIYANEAPHLREFREHLEANPAYFGRVWWAYIYGPLQLTEGLVTTGRPIRYLLVTTDVAELTLMDLILMWFFGWGLDIGEMPITQADVEIARLLNLRPSPVVVWCPKLKFWRTAFYDVRSFPDVVQPKPFPALPLALVAFFVVEWWLGRYKQHLEGLYTAFGQAGDLACQDWADRG